MRSRSTSVLFLLVFVLATGAVPRQRTGVAAASDNDVLRWNSALLQAVRNTGTGPPIVARALAITHTCMYDAWAAFDTVADGVHWPAPLRQPDGTHTDANKAEAVSFAAFDALVDQFPTQRALFTQTLNDLGYQTPGPAGQLGQTACAAVLAFRHHDGANQLGNLTPGRYADYTGYLPVNSVDVLSDPNRWQPLGMETGPQSFALPQWGLIQPFVAAGFAALRPAAPPIYPHGTYIKELNQIVHFSGSLNDRTKMIAEYWADGPATETPPGHWNLFAQAVSRRDGNTLDDDVRLFFMLGNAQLDASIAAWACKTYYDYARPVTAIRFVRGGQPIRAWAGPGLGTQMIDGSQFRSYIATPPFAEYVSGHSTFSAAAAEVLKHATGSDRFNASVTFGAGASVVEPGVTPSTTVTLSWRTFSDAADEAGLSRRYGGIHFESGDLRGRRLGRQIGARVVSHAESYFNGSAAVEW